jgi:hypothetical protein
VYRCGGILEQKLSAKVNSAVSVLSNGTGILNARIDTKSERKQFEAGYYLFKRIENIDFICERLLISIYIFLNLGDLYTTVLD